MSNTKEEIAAILDRPGHFAVVMKWKEKLPGNDGIAVHEYAKTIREAHEIIERDKKLPQYKAFGNRFEWDIMEYK